jgi:hypothetical protein
MQEKEDAFKRVELRAWENHVADLVREYASLQERMAENRGEVEDRTVVNVELSGEPGGAGIRITVHDRRKDETYVEEHSPYERSQTGDLYSPERVASDILMYVRGG